jgi:histidyl-tRNA synthetase
LVQIKYFEKIGGVKTSGIGFALGLERLLNALEAEQINLVKNNSIDAYIIPLSDNEKKDAMWLTNLLRKNEFKVDTDYMNRNLKNNFHQADRLNSKYIILIGEEEVKNKILTIKNNISKTEEKISYDNVIDYLKGRIK